tara:strand:+ start:157 stop:831 length:675 start_codon:yes stop_codon:yes gene_type:complete
MKINKAIILAAGRGSRIWPLTNDVPKAMLEINQTTLIANGIQSMKKYIDSIFITVGYKGPILAKHVIEHNVDVIFNTEGKDNAWWIYNTLLCHLNEPIFVLTCDNVTKINFRDMIEDYFSKGSPSCMLIPVKPVDGLNGDYIFHSDNIVKKLSRYNKADIYCSGIQILNPYIINKTTKKHNNFYDVWGELISMDQLFVSDVMPKKWFTVDTLDHYKKLTSMNEK